MGFDAAGLLVIDGAQVGSALGGAEGGFRLRELDIPAPQLGGIGFRAVGAQKIGAMPPATALPLLRLLMSARGRCPLHHVNFHGDEFGGGGITPL